MNHRIAFASLGLMLGACASQPVNTTPTPAPSTSTMRAGAAAEPLPLDIVWYRASAEKRAAYLQAYRTAAGVLERKATGRTPGSWGVILDADETILDNSANEQETAERHAQFSDSSWVRWVRSERAPALPGAVAFTNRVHALGGRVVIVTNRADSLCAPTRRNIQADGFYTDEVLCQTSTGDKNPRFEAVINGTAPSTLPAMTVLMWVGDNIQDFPLLVQKNMYNASEGAFAGFGDVYIVLPNPMYGSWTHNPVPAVSP